jgi:hypothetical protein
MKAVHSGMRWEGMTLRALCHRAQILLGTCSECGCERGCECECECECEREDVASEWHGGMSVDVSELETHATAWQL